MPTYIEAATGRAIPASIALDANGRVRPGISQTMGDGERLVWDPFLMDSARGNRSAGVFLTDGKGYQFGAPAPVVTDQSVVEAQRKRWMADKATSHMGDRQPAPSRQFADRAPAHRPAANGRAAIDAQRRLWLADKANSHRMARDY